jgi:hypothetical protein
LFIRHEIIDGTAVGLFATAVFYLYNRVFPARVRQIRGIQMMNRKTWKWVSLGLVVALMCGCSRGPRTYSVSGTVKMDGTPLADARVTFSDASQGRSAVGTTDASGSFVLAYVNKVGAPEGNYRVAISKQGKSPENDAALIELVPARYNRATELTAEVTKKGPNVFAFDHLTSERDAKDEQRPNAPPAAAPKQNPSSKDADATDPLLKQLDRSQKKGG